MITIKKHDILLKKRGLLITGRHIVEIESIQETLAPENKDMPWSDRTPQLAIKFKNGSGYVTLWLNTVGYMTRQDYTHMPDGVVFKTHPFSRVSYAVNAGTGERIISPEKTRVCNAMLQRLAYCCGFSDGDSLDISDLVGRRLVIVVQELNNFPKVTDFSPLKKI